MQSTRTLFRSVLVAGLLLCGAASASAQALDGQWFKIKVNTKGYKIDGANNNALVKASWSTTAYMHLTWNAGIYSFSTWTEIAPGLWNETDIGDLNPLVGADEGLSADDFLTFDRQDGSFVEGYITTRITIKRDKDGNFKSATIKSLGGEAVSESSVDGVNDYRGGFAISGKTIDPATLPFTPI